MLNNQIKITCFKQLNTSSKHAQTPARGQYLLNIILYTPNKKLKYLDPILRELNQNNQLHIVKCNNISSLGHTLNNCKFGIKTIFIIDQLISQQNLNKIFTNQELIKNKGNFICWVFTQRVEDVNSLWFHSSSIQLITIDQNKVIEMLRKQYNQIKPTLGSYYSNTTIKSNDINNMDIKLEIAESPNKLIIGAQNFYSKNDKFFGNDVPGVGTYDIVNKQHVISHGVKFDHTTKDKK